METGFWVDGCGVGVFAGERMGTEQSRGSPLARMPPEGDFIGRGPAGFVNGESSTPSFSGEGDGPPGVAWVAGCRRQGPLGKGGE